MLISKEKIVDNRQQLVKVKVDHLPTGNVRVTPTDVAENLGTWFDANKWRLERRKQQLLNLRQKQTSERFFRD